MSGTCLKRKTTSLGLVEVYEQPGMGYVLYVAGQMKKYSSDMNHIFAEYDKIN